MKRAYARREGDRREKLSALAVSLGVSVSVGAVAYYLARLLISRDAIDLEPPVALESSDALESAVALASPDAAGRLLEHGHDQR